MECYLSMVYNDIANYVIIKVWGDGVKKITFIRNILILFLICISSIVFTGCGSSKEVKVHIDKINKGKAALIAAPNINFSKTVLSEVLVEKHTSLSEAIIDNENNEWYISHAAVTNSEPKIFTESLMVDGNAYMRNNESSIWEPSKSKAENTALKFLDSEPLSLTSRDCKDIKILKEGDNEVITIVLSSSYLKKLKEKNVNNLENILNKSKPDENAIETSMEAEELTLNALKKTKYLSCELSFTIDKDGVLIGQKSYYTFEQPDVNIDSQGKMILSDTIQTLTMTTEIKVSSYNNNENKELLKKYKAEL